MGRRSSGPGERTVPVGTRTFLLTDVVGSMATCAARPDAVAAVRARHSEIIDLCVTRHGGICPAERGEGDSTLSVFGRASEALSAAIDMQAELSAEQWPDGATVAVRIGIHTGDAELRGGTSFVGQALDRCARIRSLGHGGQVLLSAATAGVVADALPADVSLVDLGEHDLRGIERRQRLFQLSHPTLRGSFPPLVAQSRRGAPRLPVYLTSFVGRAEAVSELVELLARERCVTLTGSGGCGKTRLANEVASAVATSYRDGVHWVDLAVLADSEMIGSEVATAIGVTVPSTDVVEAIAGHVEDGHLLLVLDNCEHLTAAAASLIDRLLRRCPALVFLVTSREPLNLAAESVWFVPSLELPSPDVVTVDAVVGAESVVLFVERAKRVRGRFAVTADNAAAVARICRRLDGIPLAIELAAARARTLSPQEILAGLDDRFTFLTGGPRGAIARQRTLEASVAWSHDLLTDQERLLLRRLGAFSGGFTLGAAEVVCSSDDLPELAVFDTLSNLVDRSLVVVDEAGAVTRYGLLETVRDFAKQRLSETGEGEKVRDRHLGYFVELAEQAEPGLEGDQALEVAHRLLSDLDNFRAGMDWSTQARRVDEAHRLPAALFPYFFHHNLIGEARRRLAAALQLEGAGLRARARALAPLIATHVLLFDAVGIEERVEEALVAARELDDPEVLARALLWSGWFGFINCRPDARDLLDEAAECAEGASYDLYLGFALIILAILDVLDAKIHDARARMDRTESIYRKTRFPIDGLPATLVCRAQIEGSGGDLAAGWAAIEELERVIEESPRSFFNPLGGVVRANLDAIAGDLASAQRRLSDAIQDATRMGNPMQFVLGAVYLGQALAAEGRYDEAIAFADQAIALGELAGGSQVVVPALAIRVRAAEAAGDLDTARSFADQLDAYGARREGGSARSWAHRMRARLAMIDQEPKDAETHLHVALGILHSGGMTVDSLAVLESLASLAVASGSVVEAGRLLGATDAVRVTLGIPRWPVDGRDYERDLAAVREALGADFDVIFEQGRAMTFDEVIAYVRRARGDRGRPAHGWSSLTPTEIKIVALVAEGLTNPQIAEKLFVTRGTIRTHLSHIFAKVGVSTRSELAAHAVRRER